MVLPCGRAGVLVGEVGRQQGRRAPHVGETREIGAEGGGGGG